MTLSDMCVRSQSDAHENTALQMLYAMQLYNVQLPCNLQNASSGVLESPVTVECMTCSVVQ